MAVIAKWTMPKQVMEWEQKEQQKALTRALRAYVKWFIILGGAAAFIVYKYFRDELSRVLAAMSAAAALLPLHTLSSFIGVAKRRGGFTISDKGLSESAGGGTLIWDRIEAYLFADHPGVPGIRRLEFKARHRAKWRKWAFDPALVDESALRKIMSDHLPGRCWDGMPRDLISRR